MRWPHFPKLVDLTFRASRHGLQDAELEALVEDRLSPQLEGLCVHSCGGLTDALFSSWLESSSAAKTDRLLGQAMGCQVPGVDGLDLLDPDLGLGDLGLGLELGAPAPLEPRSSELGGLEPRGRAPKVFAGLLRFSLSGGQFSNESCRKLAKLLPNVQDLGFHDCPHLARDSFERFLYRCRYLRNCQFPNYRARAESATWQVRKDGDSSESGAETS